MGFVVERNAKKCVEFKNNLKASSIPIFIFQRKKKKQQWKQSQTVFGFWVMVMDVGWSEEGIKNNTVRKKKKNKCIDMEKRREKMMILYNVAWFGIAADEWKRKEWRHFSPSSCHNLILNNCRYPSSPISWMSASRLSLFFSRELQTSSNLPALLFFFVRFYFFFRLESGSLSSWAKLSNQLTRI